MKKRSPDFADELGFCAAPYLAAPQHVFVLGRVDAACLRLTEEISHLLAKLERDEQRQLRCPQNSARAGELAAFVVMLERTLRQLTSTATRNFYF